MRRYAIAGFGCAGYNAAAELRKELPDAEIDVYTAGADALYNPMLTTYFASEKIGLKAAYPFGSLDEAGARLGLNIFSGTPAEHIDCRAKTLIDAAGQTREYDAILVSTGARSLVPGWLKCEGDTWFTMRTISDAVSLKERLEKTDVKRAVVVGASMVGIKVAELLAIKGIHTTMIDAAKCMFPLAAYESTARAIEGRLEEKGLSILMDAPVSSVSAKGVTTGDGTFLPADIVCLCIGTAANTALVADEPIELNRGIVVDEHMHTSCEGIYAAGDCCEGTNLQTGKPAAIGLWANAAAQGICAGRNMAGIKDSYYGNILHNITHFFDMDFIGLGDPALEGERHFFPGGDFTVEAVMSPGGLQSVNIFDNYKISGILKNHLVKQLLGQGGTLTDAQRGRLRENGLSPDFIKLIGGGL